MKRLIPLVKHSCLLPCCSRLLVILLLLALPVTAGAVSVDLAWDACDPIPNGYSIFVRNANRGYDYSNPAWEGRTTQATIDNLGSGETYYAVVRAVVGTNQSGNSNEVKFTTPAETPPVPANQTPVANAGADQAVSAGINVVLKGTASRDADGSIVTYQWTQTGGQAVVLKTGNSVQASFTAPKATSTTVLTFQLKVTDDQGDSAVDSCQVTVVPEVPADGSNSGSSDTSGSTTNNDSNGTVTAIRVNCGGGQYKDRNGNIWSADTGFNTGQKASRTDPIANTTDDALYKTERWDQYTSPELAYSFSVANGEYDVNLHFAEICNGLSYMGSRVFDVEIEGVLVLTNLDIFAEVGADAALIETIPVTVRDGKLDIVFRHGVEDPKISAIEVLGQGTVVGDTEPPSVPGGLAGKAVGPSSINLDWNDSSDTGGSGLGGYFVFRNGAKVGDVTGSSFSDTGLSAGTRYTYTVLAYDNAGNQSVQSNSIDVTTPSGTVTAIRVNCGGDQYTDGNGNVWSADNGFNTGEKASRKDPIADTTDDALYKTERWDRYASPELAYSFKVPNGDYDVNLHFAEICNGLSYVGSRVFDVEIEGVLALTNLDIFAEVGADTALIETIPVTVRDGKLDIVFKHGVEDPKISAIEILSY